MTSRYHPRVHRKQPGRLKLHREHLPPKPHCIREMGRVARRRSDVEWRHDSLRAATHRLRWDSKT